MKVTATVIAGLPQLDIYTLSEDWALATALENHWRLLAECMVLRPSRWIDSQGDRMYGAVVYLTTRFDLQTTIMEDDVFVTETEIIAVRRPHALSVTRYATAGATRAEVVLLTSFIKRKERGSNKKFARIRDIWRGEDFNTPAIDALLDRHHEMKGTEDAGEVEMTYEVNRMQDFNVADFMYFKNYVRLAKAVEWRVIRRGPTRLNCERECFFYGNVEDAEILTSRVDMTGDRMQTGHYTSDGKRIFLSVARTEAINIAVR
jgi:probable biosynthetic protein (TIGR04098 family)